VEADKDQYEDISTAIAREGYIVQILYLELSFETHEFIKDLDFVKDIFLVVNTMYADLRITEVQNFPMVGGGACVIGHGIGADVVLHLTHPDVLTSPHIKGIVSLSPGLIRGVRAPFGLRLAARTLTIPTLIVSNTQDSSPRKSLPYYNEISHTQCKTFVEILEGNHCWITDLYHSHVSHCFRDEARFGANPVWDHDQQLYQVFAPLLLQYFNFLQLTDSESLNYHLKAWKARLNLGSMYLTNGTTLLNQVMDWKEQAPDPPSITPSIDHHAINFTDLLYNYNTDGLVFSDVPSKNSTRAWTYLFNCWTPNGKLHSHDLSFTGSNETSRYRLFHWRDPSFHFHPFENEHRLSNNTIPEQT